MGHPYIYCGVVFGMWILVSHAFKLMTFVYNRKAAVDFIFISPLYRESVNVIYGVF